jgi:hypothetical protein
LNVSISIWEVIVHGIQYREYTIGDNASQKHLKRLDIVPPDGRQTHKSYGQTHAPPVFPLQRLQFNNYRRFKV